MPNLFDQQYLRLPPAPQLSFDPPSPFDFGAVYVSDPFRPQQVFWVTNEGPGDVHFDSIYISGRDFIDFYKPADADHCTGTDLSAGYTSDFTVIFSPRSPFEKEATVVINYNTYYTVTINLTGYALAPVITAPMVVGFGDVDVGSSRMQYLGIGNAGNADLYVYDIAISPTGDFTIEGNPWGTIAPNTFMLFQIQFTPTSIGPQTATATVYSTDPVSWSVNVSLTGVGQTQPVIAVAPPSKIFPDTPVNQTSTAQLFTVTNVNSLPLSIGTLSKDGDNPGEFKIQNDHCTGSTLTHGQSGTFEVVFCPAATGDKQAVIIIPSNDPHSPLNVPVSGRGTAPRLSVTPTDKVFENTLVGSASPPQTFTVQNTGTADLVLGTIQFEGTDAANFIKQNDSCSGSTFAPGTSGTFQVLFRPTSAGAKAAQINLPSNDPDSHPVKPGISGIGIAPAISITPDTCNFGNIITGTVSLPQNFTVSNTGSASLIVNSIVIQGANAREFSKQNDNCTGQPIAPGTSATFQIVFAPVLVGSKNATAVINSNANNLPTVSIPLAGTGQTHPVIVAAPTFKNFGDVVVGSSSQIQLFTITNSNTMPLLIGTITMGGGNPGDFSLRNDFCSGRTLAHGESATFEAVFSPSSSAEKQAAVNVPSNDPDTPNLMIPLGGRGTIPGISVQPLVKNFGDIPLGSSSLPQTFIVQNKGTADLLVGGITISGTDAADFIKVNDECSGNTFAPGMFGTFQIMFRPMSDKSESAQINIPSNDPETPVFITAVIGRGTKAGISVQPTEKNFGDIHKGSSSLPQTFTLRNGGTADLLVGSITISGADAADFIKGNDECSGNTFTPGTSGTFQVTFRPASGRLEAAQINIPSNDPDTPVLTIALAGKGIIDDISSEPAAKAYPPATPRSEPVFQAFRVTNNAKYAIRTGRAYLTAVPAPASAVNPASTAAISETVASTQGYAVRSEFAGMRDANADAVFFGAPGSEFRADDTDQFIIRNDQVSERTLQPNESSTLEAAFAPTRAGTFRAFINIPTDDPLLPLFRIPLAGTAPVGPRIAVLPFTADFGEITVGGGSAVIQFTVSSIGSSDLFITDVIVTGRYFRMFRKTNDNCSGTSLPYGSEATFGVFFAPASKGCKEATVSIYTNDLTIPVSTIWLYGRGV